LASRFELRSGVADTGPPPGPEKRESVLEHVRHRWTERTQADEVDPEAGRAGRSPRESISASAMRSRASIGIRRSIAVAPLALVAIVSIASCGSSAASSVLPSRPDQTAGATATLELLDVMPLSGARVSRDSVISADLAYSVSGFRPGDFFILWQAETFDPTRTTNGTFPHDQLPMLQDSMGTLHFSFPIQHIWDDSSVKRPFRIWFSVNRNTGLNQSVVISRTTAVDYETQ